MEQWSQSFFFTLEPMKTVCSVHIHVLTSPTFYFCSRIKMCIHAKDTNTFITTLSQNKQKIMLAQMVI